MDKAQVTDITPEFGASPPIGIHPAWWSGYEIKFIANGIEYKGKTNVGVRGMNCRCEVIVSADGVKVV